MISIDDKLEQLDDQIRYPVLQNPQSDNIIINNKVN